MIGQILPADEHCLNACSPSRPDVDRKAPMVVHCFAGISRSTAAAFAAACAINPNRDEMQIARAIRDASPTAMPNIRIVSIADRMLPRDGPHGAAAVEALGRGQEAMEGHPFRLDLL